MPVDYELFYDHQERRLIFAGNGAEIDNPVRYRMAIQHACDSIIGAMTRLGPTMPAI